MFSSENSLLNLPKVEEWAIISQQRALQNERMIQMQRLAEYNKKMQFKNQLDHQISQKLKPSRLQQKSDRDYLQYILKKAHEQKQKQQNEKISRIIKRKQIQQQNMQALNELRNFRPRSKQPEYALDIGVKSEILQKEREKRGIQQMMDTLDLQVKQKSNEKKGKRSQSRIERNNSLISEESINPYKAKNYHQDLKVYQAYQKVLNQKKREQEQFYKKITEEAAVKKQFQNEQRRRKELRRKQELTNQMMHTLDTQVKVQNMRKHEERQMNPEQNSFRFIDNMFRQKPAAYDKQKYSEELKNQAEQQNQRKMIHKYMSQEQYKLNMNRLNKIVSGEYINDSYLDRSLDNIGAVPLKNQTVKNYGQNAEFIKKELEKLKRQRNGFYSRMQNSYH